MTYVFQHREEANRIKMIEAQSMKQANEKLKERLSNGYKNMSGRLVFDSFYDYYFDFNM